MDRIRSMQAFVRVAETRNFTHVAEEFDTQQPTVSKWIAGLESYLRVQLLNRSARRIELTAAGEVYYQQCLSILADIEAAETKVREGTITPQGQIRLSMPTVFGREYIVPFVRTFSQRYPDIQLSLMLTDRQVDLVAEGVDLAIRVGEINQGSLIARKLTRFQSVIVSSPAYLAKSSKVSKPEELSQHPCLLHSLLTDNQHWAFEKNGNTFTVAITGQVKSNSSDALKQLVTNDFGFAMLPDWMVKNEIKKGSLVQILKDYQLKQKTIYIVYPQRKFLPLAIRCFIEELLKKFDTNT